MKVPLVTAEPRIRAEAVAFTLLELLVASGVGSLLLLAVCTLALFASRSFVAVGNYSDLDRASRNALDVLSREVRQCRSLTAFTTNKLTLLDNETNTLIFEYKTDTKQLTRQGSNSTRVLLTECDFLSF